MKGTSSGLLKHSAPHRTYRKHTTTEKALCVGCFCTTSGWFKHSEPTRTTPSQRSRCVGCCYTSSGWYKHIEPHRTYTNHTITELSRCVGCLGTRSGWFKHSEPTRTTMCWCASCRFAVLDPHCWSCSQCVTCLFPIFPYCSEYVPKCVPDCVRPHPSHQGTS